MSKPDSDVQKTASFDDNRSAFLDAEVDVERAKSRVLADLDTILTTGGGNLHIPVGDERTYCGARHGENSGLTAKSTTAFRGWDDRVCTACARKWATFDFPDPTLEPPMSPHARSILETAYDEGYFEWPRKATQIEIAAADERRRAAVHEHLRNGIRAVAEYAVENDAEFRERVTDRQFEMFETAVDLGYFEFPRDLDQSELAESVGLSTTTISEHLRIALREAIEFADITTGGE